MRFEKSCGVIIFFNKRVREYLLLLYPGGHWDFIKGNVEKGEDELETAKREAKEEADISDLTILEGFKEKINYFYQRDGDLIKKEVIFFLAEANDKDVKLSFEHNDFSWLPYSEALLKVTYENARQILKKAEEYLSKIIR